MSDVSPLQRRLLNLLAENNLGWEKITSALNIIRPAIKSEKEWENIWKNSQPGNRSEFHRPPKQQQRDRRQTSRNRPKKEKQTEPPNDLVQLSKSEFEHLQNQAMLSVHQATAPPPPYDFVAHQNTMPQQNLYPNIQKQNHMQSSSSYQNSVQQVHGHHHQQQGGNEKNIERERQNNMQRSSSVQNPVQQVHQQQQGGNQNHRRFSNSKEKSKKSEAECLIS